jgi:hypothetical protein
MARPVLTPSRQLAAGAAAVAAALVTVAVGVWLAAVGSPNLDGTTARTPLRTTPAALLEAAGSDALLTLDVPGPRSILDILQARTTDATTSAEVVTPTPGGGLAAQPPAPPPPPSPPPGAVPDPVTTVVETVEETADDTEQEIEDLGSAIDEVLADQTTTLAVL